MKLMRIIAAAIFLFLPALASAATVEIVEIKNGSTGVPIPLVEINGDKFSLHGTAYNRIDVGNTETYYQPTAEIISALTPEQRAEIAHACEFKAGKSKESCGNLYATDSETKEILDEKRSSTQFEAAGGVALKLFNYAMGQTSEGSTTNTCITCPFLGNFLIGLTNFSYATYLYFEIAFSTIVPIMMGAWLGWKAIGLFFNGGEDGRAFIGALVKRLALFFVIWMAITVGNHDGGFQGPTQTGRPLENPKWAWDAAGPHFLSYAFSLSSEVRDNTIKFQNTISQSDFKGVAAYDAFQCQTVGDNISIYTNSAVIQKFATSAVEVACATERVHMVGVSSAIAILGSAQAQFSIWSGKAIAAGIVKLIAGFFMLFVFGLSAIWFTFLILDVAVRGLITAAFLPVIAAMYLFEVTRGFAVNAVRAMGGALVTAVAISIVSTLAYYLLTRTVTVYNSAFPLMGEVYGDDVIMTEINTDNAINAFREFIVRIQESESSNPQIPMDFSAPWFYYLVLSSLAIFTLGKKIIAMLESMIGAQGASAMADNAMRLTRTGLSLGMMAAAPTAAFAMWGARGGWALGSAGTGFGTEALKQLNPFGNNAGGGGGGLQAAAMSASANLLHGTEPPNGE